MTTPTPGPFPSGYNTDATTYGNWDPNFVPSFLVGALFTTAFVVLIILLLVHWGKSAVMGEDPGD